MPQWLKRARWLRAGMFAAVGVLLIATSDLPDYGIHYSGGVVVPTTELDNDAPARRITFRYTLRDEAQDDPLLPTHADVDIWLSATHSDEAPQTQADNTPWVTARLDRSAADAGVAPAPGPPAGDSVFLDNGHLAAVEVPAPLPGDSGEFTVEISRQATSSPIVTRVQWVVVFSAFVPTDDERQVDVELPWEIGVSAEAGP